ncbi:hypothetical protein GQ54DRAFT_314994, partial [Martensiomyces pterosporus]
QLRYLKGAPSVQMQEAPPDIQGFLEDQERHEKEVREDRAGGREEKEERQGRREHLAELYEGDEDVDQEDEAGLLDV